MSARTTARALALVPAVAAVAADRVAAAVEAVLLTTDMPVATRVLAALLSVDEDDVESAVDDLARDYDEHGHGFTVQRVAGGWRLVTRPEFAAVLERHLDEGQRVRLTQAALEALAVIAYQQPATRSHVSSVRGVASDGVLRTLVGHGLVEECGTDDSGALRYRTTPMFLERIGLDSLDGLPALAPHLPDLAELVPADGADDAHPDQPSPLGDA